jgi:uncharacterized membrane protein YcjF (UPF0283 family)
MFAVLVVAVIAWVGVLCRRRVHFLELSRRYREQAIIYAAAASHHIDAVALVAHLKHSAATAKPPTPSSDHRAWSAYRKHITDLQRMIRIADARLDEYGGYLALRRHCERLSAKYGRAAMRPWIGVEAETPGVE